MSNRIGYKIIILVGSVVTLALVITGVLYAQQQRMAIQHQNERTMQKLTESVIQGLQSVMLAGYADVAQSFADRLKNVPEIVDFRIIRTNGLEAFRDNQTIHDVNQRRGEEEFIPRIQEQQYRVLEPWDPNLNEALRAGSLTSYYENGDNGETLLTYLAPIQNLKECGKCHGSEKPYRGLIKLTTSLAPVEKEIQESWLKNSLLIGTMIGLVLVFLAFVLRHSLVDPIDRVTRAMQRAADGNLKQEVPVLGRDELSLMASSFNRMTRELASTYSGLQQEQDKLSTIILSAREGMVVTDRSGRVALVNPAAERLLGKSASQIQEEGFLGLFNDPERLLNWIETPLDHKREPQVVEFNGHTLSVYAARIQSPENEVVGSACLMRDISAEKQLEHQLRKLSETDNLTGLYNRRYLDQTLMYELKRHLRYGEKLAVLMMDIDHFKRFNDEHGHDQGDRVLVAVAHTARDQLRNIDHPCRYGGEEFTMILPETGTEGAMVVAERIRTAIEALVVDGLKVTLSIGVAVLEGDNYDVPEALLGAADQALYQAKNSGRNRVCLAES